MTKVISFLLLVALLCVSGRSAVELKCNRDSTRPQEYTIQSSVEPFYANDFSEPGANSTSVASRFSLVCEGEEIRHENKKLQQWRVDIASIRMKQPCPDGAGWSHCDEEFQCEDTYEPNTNVVYFYVETYPQNGIVYWDPSQEAQSWSNEEACFTKYAILQQIQGALKSDIAPAHKKARQQSRIEKGVLLASNRFENADRPADVKVPGSNMSAQIIMSLVSGETVEKNDVARCTAPKQLPTVSRPNLANATLFPVFSEEANCPNLESYTRRVTREHRQCDSIEGALKSFLSNPSEPQYERLLNCLIVEDRREVVQKYIDILEASYKQSFGLKKWDVMRDSLSLMILMPSVTAVNRAAYLVNLAAVHAPENLVFSMMQMIAFSPYVEKVGVPEQLSSVASYYLSHSNPLVKKNALLLLASISRRTGVVHKALNPLNILDLDVITRVDILRNLGDAYSVADFFTVFPGTSEKVSVHEKVLLGTLANRSDRAKLIELITQEPRFKRGSFQYNVTIPEFSYNMGSKDLVGFDYKHAAYAGLEYDSCQDHDRRGFRFNVDADTHLNLFYFDNTYQLWELIVQEDASSDSEQYKDYVRVVWRNDVIIDGPVAERGCTEIRKNLLNRRFDFPIANLVFQIGPVPVRIGLAATTLLDVNFYSKLCPVQFNAIASVDPSVDATLTGSVCAGVVVIKACVDASGHQKAQANPTLVADARTCPYATICPSADLEFTGAHIGVYGSLKIKTPFKSKEYKLTIGEWKFPDITKELIDPSKCLRL